ncbi:MAG: NADH-quinone oxidoreductase subunit I [Thermoproteota archaeon]|nr:MAG: NADH-quinone oxidoreductase subunit I [Candidatus Korarchaeota archaeon]
MEGMRLPKAALLREVLSNLLRRPVTIEYPKVPIEPERGFRGRHVVDGNKCIGCRLCAVECPTGAIEMRKYPQKEKPVPVIHYDLCIFCYHCVYVCPVKAYITTGNRYMPTPDRGEMVGEPVFKSEGENIKVKY